MASFLPDESVSGARRSYRRLVPQPLKSVVHAVATPLARLRNDLRWKLMSPQRRRMWIDARLNLKDSTWLFVLGVNNSGTTLLTRILGLHPYIRDLHAEGQRLTRALPKPIDFDLRRMWSHRIDAFRWTEDDDPTPAARAMYDWAPHFARGSGYLLEKSPPNTVRSRWLQANFRPCRFLVVTRNPYAVAEGVRRRRNCTLEEAAEHWALAHTALHEDFPLLQHALHITYERLCDDTQAVLRDIESFLNLPQPFDMQLLEREFDVHNMQDTPALIQNFNERSIARLSPSEVATVTRNAGIAMSQWGYTPVASSDD